jgi:hypothetical protein
MIREYLHKQVTKRQSLQSVRTLQMSDSELMLIIVDLSQ